MVAGYAFSIVALIIIFIALVLFVVDAWYWSQLYFGNVVNTSISQTTAGWLFAFNVLLAVIMLAIFIYVIYTIATMPKTPAPASVTSVSREKTVAAPAPVLDADYNPLPVQQIPVRSGQSVYRISTVAR